MENLVLTRHRLKLFVIFLIALSLVAGLIAKSQLDQIKQTLFESAMAENQGEGFNLIISEMSQAGAYVEAQTETGSIDRAQGYRYIIRQMAQWQSLFMTDFNADFPSISRCPSRMCKYGFDNPDTVYLLIHPLSPKHQYRLKIKPGSLAYTTYQLFGISGGGGFQTGGTIESQDIAANELGKFELLLSVSNPENHPNFLQIPSGRGGQLVIRQLIRDWNKETENAYSLEVVPGDEERLHSPTILDMNRFDRRAVGLARFFADRVKGYREILAAAPVNQLPQGRGGTGVGDGGFPTNFTSQMRYEIEEGQALLIEIPKVEVVYSNIQLGSLWGSRWFIPLAPFLSMIFRRIWMTMASTDM